MVDFVSIELFVFYGGYYFLFVIIGVVFVDYLSVFFYGFFWGFRMVQMLGTFEVMLVIFMFLYIIIIGSVLYKFLWLFLWVLIYIVVVVVFGAWFLDVNVFVVLLILVLSVLFFGAVGMFGVFLILVLKVWESVILLFVGLSFLFGGVLYFVVLLLGAVQVIVWGLLIIHVFEVMCGVLLVGHGVGELVKLFGILVGFMVVILFIVMWAFQKALECFRVEGSVTYY